jgi:hypothetical protein
MVDKSGFDELSLDIMGFGVSKSPGNRRLHRTKAKPNYYTFASSFAWQPNSEDSAGTSIDTKERIS